MALRACKPHSLQKLYVRLDIDAKDAELPSLCVDVTGKTLRLVRTADMNKRYIALSYRWADNTERCTMTRNNY